LPLQSRSPKRGSPFPSPIYFSSSSQRSSPLSTFERAFEAIGKNNKNCKETFRKYNFRKPIIETCASEQVGLIFIFGTKEEQEQDNLQQYQEGPSQQKEPTQEQTP